MPRHTLSPFRTLGVFACLVAVVLPASAEVRRMGDTVVAFNKTRVPPFGMAARYPDVAYDPLHDVYLVVAGQQPIEGRFVSASGQPLGSTFRVSPSAGTIASRVDYNRVTDTFVVTWIDEGGSGAGDDAITALLLRYNGAGGATVLTGEMFFGRNGVGKHTESAPSVACATNSAECLVTWAQWAAPWNVIGQRIDAATGAPIGPEIPVGATGDWEALPSVAYNSAQNEYFVVHTSEAPNGVMYTVGERIQAGTGAHLGRSTLYGHAGLNNYPEVAYNSRGNLYVVITWFFNAAPTGADVFGRLVDGNGSPASPVIPVAANTFFEGGDGIGLAYNAHHDGFLAVFQGPSQDTLAVELNGLGSPAAPVFRAMESGAARDIYQPQVAGATNAGRYLIATSVDHNRVSTQLIDTSTAGPPPPSNPPGSPPPTDPSAPIDLVNAPNGSWFFAEGVAAAGGLGFNTFYLIANEHDAPVLVRAYFAAENGATRQVQVTVPGRSRHTINLAEAAGRGAFGAVFQSLTPGLDIFVERSVYWGSNFEGSTSEVAVKNANATWFFAEGACGCGFFANFFLLFNPNQQAVQVTATFLLDNGQTTARAYTIGPQSRLTIFANELPELQGHNFGTRFDGSQAIVAERTMYWGSAWLGGTASIGAKAPSPIWHFAEGAAAPGFDTFYLVMNPTSTPTTIHARFSLLDGRVDWRSFPVGANSRANIWLNQVLGHVGAVAATFITDGFAVPVVVERSIYWAWQGDNGWLEGTNSVGVSAAANVWHVPEGSTGGLFEDFLLVFNPTETQVTVNVTVFTEQGHRETLFVTVPALGRETLYMHQVLTALGLPSSMSFATRVEAQGAGQIVVEHAMYWQRAGGAYWRSGGSSFGIRH
jgi:hypothetical protein